MAHALCVSMFSCLCNGDEIRPTICTIFTWLWADSFYWNLKSKVGGGSEGRLAIETKMCATSLFFSFFFYWQCGRGNLLSSSHKNDLHKNAQEWATKERVPSQHGLMTLCLFAYIYLYNYAEVPYLQLNLAVRRMLHKASSKEKKERDPLWHLWPHQNEQPLVYPVNVTHFKDLC